jgi:hypothetical protein
MLSYANNSTLALIYVLIMSFQESNEIDKLKTLEAHMSLYRSPDYPYSSLC